MMCPVCKHVFKAGVSSHAVQRMHELKAQGATIREIRDRLEREGHASMTYQAVDYHLRIKPQRMANPLPSTRAKKIVPGG